LRSKVEESSSETAKRDLADYFSSIQEKVVKRFESLKAEVNDALVPHQMDEVNQEVAKMALKRQLPFKCDYLASPYLLSFDERISEEVRAKIRAATKREVEKHKEEIDNAISNTQRKVLELFPKELRSSVEVILNSQDKRTFVQPAEGAENGD
jgi:type III secretory pathway component EscV